MRSGIGRGSGLAEKLEHSVILDLLQILLYGYFAYVFYNNFEIGQEVMEFSTDPNVVAFQLAVALIAVESLQIVHDRYVK